MAMLFFSIHPFSTYAQHITLRNASLEGIGGANVAPEGWTIAANTPDIQPGAYNVFRKASSGKTFVALQAGPKFREGIEQRLDAPLVAGRAYAMSFDLGFSRIYGHEHCYANLIIFGGNAPGDTAELLWTSGAFTDTAWNTHSIVFTPSATYTYISVYSNEVEPCPNQKYGIVTYLDNLSMIRQILKTELTALPSCKSAPTGSVAVKVGGGKGPYSYLWTPGYYRTPQVSKLRAGSYEVQITSADGVMAKGKVTVEESDLASTTAVTVSDCFGDNKNSIELNITGGIPPYSFSINGEAKYGHKFNDLTPGNYEFVVTDQQVCADTFNVVIKEPDPVVIKEVKAEPCSCSEAEDGRISWVVEGGTPPYKYQVNNDMWQVENTVSRLKHGTYHYEVEDAHGCREYGTTVVESPWKNCVVVMPSAFSPNGDGNNDLFRPKVYDDIKQYQLKVYNRWGGLVYQTSDPKAGWDGSANGQPQMSQTFIYVCNFRDRKDELQEFRGSVILLR
ncbi:T9SS type B sorting domain-containing protein [Chitinophaga tropicalis]|nr:gliding motility-associated C-terminal domain-containing protein [Chitinophaga tropicalis]